MRGIKGEAAEINSLAQGIARLNNEITAGIARRRPAAERPARSARRADRRAVAEDFRERRRPGRRHGQRIHRQRPAAGARRGRRNQLTTVQIRSIRRSCSMRCRRRAPWTSRNISGGTLGGLLDWRSEMLDPARNELGRIGVALSDVVNAQHREGMDLTGALGGDFFASAAREVLDNGQHRHRHGHRDAHRRRRAHRPRLHPRDHRHAAGSCGDPGHGRGGAMTGTGTAADPFVADGLSDRGRRRSRRGDPFLIRPTRGAITDMSVPITDPSRIAAAAPIRTAADTANTGTGTISPGEVLDAECAAARSRHDRVH